MTCYEDITYAQKLKELRIRDGYVQKTMADLLCCSQQEYSELENGNKRFTKELIKKTCSIFKIEPAEFEVHKTIETPQQAQMDPQLSSALHTKLTSIFEDKTELNSIVQLFNTKHMLENQLKMLEQLIDEKKK